MMHVRRIRTGDCFTHRAVVMRCVPKQLISGRQLPGAMTKQRADRIIPNSNSNCATSTISTMIVFIWAKATGPFTIWGWQRPVIQSIRRARRFADLYVDEQAGNYDPQNRIIRSPFHGSGGPRHHGELELVKRALDPVYYPGGVARGHAQRANLHPRVVDLEEDWHEDPQRCEEICRLFDEIVLCGDIPDNLACTGLMTNAYLHTGDEKYRQCVLDYSQSWLERIHHNDGIIPDNVGLSGKIGERRGGQWWGGWYGWNSRNSARNALLAATVVAECCLLLAGDSGYLELIRSQIEMLVDRAITREDGQLLVPTRMMPDGWTDFQPLHLQWLGRLYHASMHEHDRALIERLKEAMGCCV